MSRYTLTEEGLGRAREFISNLNLIMAERKMGLHSEAPIWVTMDGIVTPFQIVLSGEKEWVLALEVSM
jgi:hypothetical protein